MSRNKKARAAKPAAAPAAAPSVESPGGNLPAEVTAPPAGSSAREREIAREENEVFTAFRSELGSAGTVSLHRSHPNSPTTRPGYVGTIAAHDFTIERVTEMYGGGDFIARAKVDGSRFSGTERRFTIDHAIPPKNPKAGAERKEPPPVDIAGIVTAITAALPKPAPENTSLLQTMIAQQTTIMTEAMRRPEPKQDPAMLTALESIVRLVDKVTTRLDRLEERISQPTAAPTLKEQMADMVEFAEAMGFSRDGGKGGEDSNFWKDLGKGAAEALAPILKNHFAGAVPAPFVPPLLTQPMVPAPTRAAPASPPASISVETSPPTGATPGAATETPEMHLALNAMIGRFRSAAIDAARKQSDPVQWVASMLGFVPVAHHRAIFNTANAKDWFAQIFAGDPEAPQHLQFLMDVRNAILLHAFVAYTTQAAANPAATVEQLAKDFIGWASPDFQDPLFDATDPENWAQIFAGSQLNPAWLEGLRVALDRELDGEEEAAAATPAASVAPIAEEPAAGKLKAPRGKKTA